MQSLHFWSFFPKFLEGQGQSNPKDQIMTTVAVSKSNWNDKWSSQYDYGDLFVKAIHSSKKNMLTEIVASIYDGT